MHLCKSQSFKHLFFILITQLKTTFSTIRTQYITNQVLMDLTKGFRCYSYFKCVHKLKF